MSKLYQQAKRMVRDRIRRGVHPVNAVLPSVEVLAEDAACGVGTMRRALRELSHEGIVRNVRNRGAVVLQIPSTARVCLLLASDLHSNGILQTPLAQSLMNANCAVEAVPWLEDAEAVERWLGGRLSQPRPFDALVALGAERYLELPGFTAFARRFPRRVFFSAEPPPLAGTPDAQWVTLDYAAAARQVMGHFLELGHRRIAVFADYHPDKQTVYSETARACRDLLEIAGATYVPCHANGDLPRLVGEHGVTAYWDLNDFNATANLLAAQQAGLAVPRHVSLVGRNDTPWASQCTPSLTTLSWEPVQLAAAIADAVTALPHPVRPPVLVTPRLVVRQSTGRAPTT